MAQDSPGYKLCLKELQQKTKEIARSNQLSSVENPGSRQLFASSDTTEDLKQEKWKSNRVLQRKGSDVSASKLLLDSHARRLELKADLASKRKMSDPPLHPSFSATSSLPSSASPSPSLLSSHSSPSSLSSQSSSSLINQTNNRSPPIVVRIPLTETAVDAGGKLYTIYHAVITSEQNPGDTVEWKISARYKVFYSLHKMLEKKFPYIKLSKFPPKSLFTATDNDKFIETRRQLLENYLQEVFSQRVLFVEGVQLVNNFQSGAVEENKMQGHLLVFRYKSEKWKRFWFVLNNGFFYYYRKETDAAVKGVIDLFLCAVRPTDNDSFEMITPTKTLPIKCERENEVEAWIEALKKEILSIRSTVVSNPDQNTRVTPVTPASPVSIVQTGPTVVTATAGPTVPMSPISRQIKPKPNIHLSEQVAEPLNLSMYHSMEKPILKAGYIKMKPRGKYSWNRRWVVLQDDHLFTYKSPQEMDSVLDTINIVFSTAKEITTLSSGASNIHHSGAVGVAKKPRFEIITPETTFIFAPETTEEMAEWVTLLRQTSTRLMNTMLRNTIRKSGSFLTYLKHEFSEFQSNEMKNKEVFRELLEQSGNSECADCCSKDPRWAVSNIGVFICIDCAGIHRKMGVDISKVRSLTLDAWSPEQIEFMASMGNAKVNSTYEGAGFPPDFKRIDASSTLEEREEFIRAKYEKKEFMKSS